MCNCFPLQLQYVALHFAGKCTFCLIIELLLPCLNYLKSYDYIKGEKGWEGNVEKGDEK